jgi:uncharacterized protein YgbK (DUF1537 family)
MTPRLVILDDDPTGTQCVHDVPVITAWEPDDVRWALQEDERGFFVLTNTRALAGAAAAARITAIADTVEAVAAELGLAVEFVLRGDSTLRGHYPLEPDVLEARARAQGRPYDALLIVPAYPEAGRVTDGDVHWVTRDGARVPVGETDYARDASFGFRSSNVREWVQEKTGGRIPATAVASIDRSLLSAGVEAVAALLESCREARPVVVNALGAADFETVARAVALARSHGTRVLARTGPSFAAALLGVVPRPPLQGAELVPQGAAVRAAAGSGSDRHGLVVVGSHVELTSRQLARLRVRRPELPVIELEVRGVLRDAESGAAPGEGAEERRVAALLDAALDRGDAVLATSRERVSTDDAERSLEIAALVSRALVRLAASLARAQRLAWVIAKGGITSSDIATQALGLRRARVRGQLFPGTVSLWEGEGMACVIFAGNVGNDESLADAVTMLHDAGEALVTSR